MHKYSIRLILAIALLILSLSALVWGLLPGERVVLHQTIHPTEMQVPTPLGYIELMGTFPHTNHSPDFHGHFLPL